MYSIITILTIKIHSIPQSKSEGMITDNSDSIYWNQQNFNFDILIVALHG